MQRCFTILILLALSVLPLQAATFFTTNVYAVGADQTVADEQWVAAGIVTTEGTFKNDLFVTSGNGLLLNGTYEGNIWGAAGISAEVGGNCQRNVRLTGKTVRIDGTIGGNLIALAETIIIGTNAVLEGSARLFASQIVQEGRIGGNLHITAARVATLSGRVDGSVRVFTQDLLLAQGASIGGDLRYTANKMLVPDEGIVGGTVTRVKPKPANPFSTARLLSHGMWFLAALIAGIPFISLFPMTTAMASQLIRKAPLKCLLVGFVASGALPLFGLMSISSIIGLPLGSMILLSWGVLAYLSRIIMGLLIGSLILRSISMSVGQVILSMALGLGIIYLATLFPAFGLPVQLAVIWLGMGSLLLALIQKRRLIIQVPQDLKHLEELRNEQNKPEEK